MVDEVMVVITRVGSSAMVGERALEAAAAGVAMYVGARAAGGGCEEL